MRHGRVGESLPGWDGYAPEREWLRWHLDALINNAGNFFAGQEFCAANAAVRFGVEGWMESLRYDLAPYNIHTTVVEPGFCRTELLVDASTTWPELSIDDYTDHTAPTIEAWKGMNGSRVSARRERSWDHTCPREVVDREMDS